MDNSRLVVYGCGTQGLAIIEFILIAGLALELRLTDDNPELWGQTLFGMEVVPPKSAFEEGPGRFVCAIGDNTVRAGIHASLKRAGHLPVEVVHPSAVRSPSARIGSGTIVMPRAVVNTEASVGEACLLNTASVVEHHCEIGDCVHLAPGTLLGGGARVGSGAFLGLGAIVLPGVVVGARSVVGAGTVVIRDVSPGMVVAGNPARTLRVVGDPTAS